MEREKGYQLVYTYCNGGKERRRGERGGGTISDSSPVGEGERRGKRDKERERERERGEGLDQLVLSNWRAREGEREREKGERRETKRGD